MGLGISLGCGVAPARHPAEARSDPTLSHEHIGDRLTRYDDLDPSVVAQDRLDSFREPLQIGCAVSEEVGQLPGVGQVGGTDKAETAGRELVLVVK